MESLFEMANLHKKDSQLPFNLYFTCNGDKTIKKHNVLRIKVQRDEDNKVNATNLSTLVFYTTPGYSTITDVKWVGKAPKKTEVSDSDLDRIVRYIKQNWGTVVKH